MDLTELIEQVEREGIRVQWVKLRGVNACWDPGLRTIWLDPKLEGRPRWAKSVLAHEYAHAILGHEGRQSPNVEDTVDRLAATLLIDEDALHTTWELYEGNMALMAYELGVTEQLVRARLSGLTHSRNWCRTSMPVLEGTKYTPAPSFR